MAEPGGLQSMGSQRVGHDLATEHTHGDPLGMQDLHGDTFFYVLCIL